MTIAMHHKAGSAGSSVTEGTDVPRMAGAFTEREHPIGDRQHAYQLASRKTLPCSAPPPLPVSLAIRLVFFDPLTLFLTLLTFSGKDNRPERHPGLSGAREYRCKR